MRWRLRDTVHANPNGAAIVEDRALCCENVLHSALVTAVQNHGVLLYTVSGLCHVVLANRRVIVLVTTFNVDAIALVLSLCFGFEFIVER